MGYGTNWAKSLGVKTLGEGTGIQRDEDMFGEQKAISYALPDDYLTYSEYGVLYNPRDPKASADYLLEAQNEHNWTIIGGIALAFIILIAYLYNTKTSNSPPKQNQ